MTSTVDFPAEAAPASSPVTAVKPAPRLLHLGCGLVAPPEWLNVDGSINAWLAQKPKLRRMLSSLRLVPRTQLEISWPRNVQIVDLRKRLPWADNSFDAVFSSHLLEHLYRQEALKLLKEAHRVLAPGGLCRMLVPDLRAIVLEYMNEGTVEGDVGAADDPARRMCRRLLMRNENPRRTGIAYRAYTALTDFHDHKWMYDGPSLVKLMTEGGFSDCSERGFLHSDIPHLDKVELPGRVLHGAGVVVEGRKGE